MLDVHQWVRIRFRKEGDLRWISHRDLARLLERLFRRAEIPLGMSQGFHPKARISFPSALSLGIRGVDEIVEIELARQMTAQQLTARLDPHLLPGLTINSAEVLNVGRKSAQADRFCYAIPVPPERQQATKQAIDTLLAKPSYPLYREGREQPLDLRAGLDRIELAEGTVRFSLPATRTASVRPREVLDAIGLSDLEDAGYYLTRTAVQLAPPIETKRTSSHEKGNAD